MGEVALSLRLGTDGDIAEKCWRVELKRSLECVVGSEVEAPNKKLAVEASGVVDRIEVRTLLELNENKTASAVESECLLGNNEVVAVECSNGEDNEDIEAECLNECVVDTVEVGSVGEERRREALNDGNFSTVESGRDECVLETSEVEMSDEKPPGMKSLDNGHSPKVESRLESECALRNTEGESSKVETSEEQPPEMKSLNNEHSPKVESRLESDSGALCNTEAESSKVEILDEQPPEMKSLNNEHSPKVESRFESDCALGNTEDEVPQEQAQMESLENENSLVAVSKCLNGCVSERGRLESLNDGDFSTVETGLNECVLESIKVETSNEQPPEVKSLNNERSPKVESRSESDCVLGNTEAEVPEEQPQIKFLENESSSVAASKCLNECVNEKGKLESLNDENFSTVESGGNECNFESNKVEMSDEEPPKMKSVNNEHTPKVESRSESDCVLGNAEAEVPQEPSQMESLDDENSSLAVSKCLNECVSDIAEAEIPDRELKIESLNDDESSKAKLQCSKECVLDIVEAEIPNKKPEAEALNDASFSNPELRGLNECVCGNIEAETPDPKLAIESLDDKNNYLDDHNSCEEDLIRSNDRVFYASEAVTHDSSTPEEFSTEEKNSRAELKRSHEWIVDSTELQSPSKKPALRSLSYEISSELSGRLLDASNAESPNNRPVNEALNGESSKAELECIHEFSVDAGGADCLSNKPSIISTDNKNFTTLESKLDEGVDISLDAAEAVTPNKESLQNEGSSGVERHECGANHLESDCLDNKPTIRPSSVDRSSRVVPNCLNECVLDITEVETPNNYPAKEFSDLGNSLTADQRCLYEYDIDGTEGETHEKSLAKELSTESVSEVLNPNVSPHENGSSSQTVSSQPVEGLLRSGCRDKTSSNAGDSSAELADKEGSFVNDFPDSLSKSEVVSEGSKVPNTHGIKRIVFTFSKSKNCNNVVTPLASHPSCMDSDSGFCYGRRHGEAHMNYSKVKLGMTDILENYTKNVKKLLSTGILDGAEVKYINEKKEVLRGIIKDCGYLCGCALCNFSKVLNSHEFEHHAGCKTKHPNDHVFLENGRSLYSIVQELRRSPASSFEGTIRALVGPIFNEKSYFEWKESLEIGNFQTKEKDCQMESHLNLVGFPQLTMSCSSEETEDNPGSVSRSTMKKFPLKHKTSLLQSISKGGKQVTKSVRTSSPSTSGGRTKKRDNDLHRLLFLPNGLPDGAELAYYAKGQRVLDGYKQGNGIVCSCCETEISPSQFEAHAGCSAKRQPYRHIFTSSGVSLHDIAVSLSKGQCLAISNSSEKCTVCGDGGDLVVCDACAHGFHGACLELKCIPEEGWYCPYCKDKIGSGRKVASTEPVVSVKPITIRLTRIVKPPVAEVGGCVVCRIPDFSVLKFDERTVILCDQCEKEYHVGCLRKLGLCDLKELPQGKWFCCDSCNRIHATLQNLISATAKVIPTSMSNRINRKLIQKGLTYEVGNDVQWKVISGKFGPEEHGSLLSSAVTLFRDSFDPIVERSGRDLIPAMVYGRNVSGQEFGGMYCAVLSVKSVVVSAGLLRIFGMEVAELPLVATAKECQGRGYFQVLFTCIEKLLRFLNVEKLVLPAAEDAKSIWTKKFGFKKMTDDQFLKYTRDIQLISFKGTLMLEKTVVSQPK